MGWTAWGHKTEAIVLASLDLAALMGDLFPWTCVFCMIVTEEMRCQRITELQGSNHWD